MSLEPAVQPTSKACRMVKLGLLGVLCGAGALEFASFAFFGCPCINQVVVPDQPNRAPDAPPSDNAPARLGMPST